MQAGKGQVEEKAILRPTCDCDCRDEEFFVRTRRPVIHIVVPSPKLVVHMPCQEELIKRPLCEEPLKKMEDKKVKLN